MELSTKYFKEASTLEVISLSWAISINIDRLCNSIHKYKANMFVLETSNMEASIIHNIKTLEESINLLLLELTTTIPIKTQKILTKGSQLKLSAPMGFDVSNRNDMVENNIMLNNFLLTFRISDKTNIPKRKIS